MPIAPRHAGARTLALLVLLVLSLLPAAPAAAAPAAAGASTAAVEVRLADLVNAARRQAGVGAVRVDVRLVAPARAWSAALARRGGLMHDEALASRLPAGVLAHAENLAYTARSGDVADALHDLLMGSAPHRRNLLDPRYTEVGIGVARDGRGTYVTQRFTAGARAAVAPAVTGIARLAAETFTEGAEHAVLVRDDVFADALAAGPLAGDRGPLLLTPPGPVTHPSVRLALERTLPRGRTVWVVGGSTAVSDGVLAELTAAGWDVRRVSGANRISTAAAVAQTLALRDGAPGTVVVATGGDWPDALAGGAYGARHRAPVLLTRSHDVPAETAHTLAALRPRTTAVLGGSAAVSDGVVRSLGAVRVAGATRQGTASETARRLWRYTDASPPRWIAVPAFGEDAWTWALGAAPLAAKLGAPVLLVGPALSGEVRDYVAGLGYGGARTAELTLVGPVPAAAAAELRALLR